MSRSLIPTKLVDKKLQIMRSLDAAIERAERYVAFRWGEPKSWTLLEDRIRRDYIKELDQMKLARNALFGGR